MRLCNNAYISLQFNSMSLIKNAYVCAVNGQPELFETEEQAQEYALELSFEWKAAGSNSATMPLLAVMSVTDWLQAQELAKAFFAELGD